MLHRIAELEDTTLLDSVESLTSEYDPDEVFQKFDKELMSKCANIKLGDNYSPYDHTDQIFQLKGPIGQ